MQSQGFSGFLGDLNRSNFLLGNLFGLRTTLAKYGVSVAVQETSEVLGDPVGGIKQTAEYDGLTQAILQLDTQRAFGWHGGIFNISALQVHGRNLSAEALGTLQTSSGIEADRSTRLWELWYDQKLLPEDRLDVRIGQQSVDQEFIVTPNGAYFLNTMFGWPLAPSVDLPGGGPAYPLSALGVRVRYRPINSLAILAGIYNGSPVGSGAGDPQKLNASGLSFPLKGGALSFLEAQFTSPALGAMVLPGEGAPLGRTLKLGIFYDTERFADQALSADGRSLALTGGPALSRRGDYTLYAVLDQMLWRQLSHPNRSLSAFVRVLQTPQANRNLVDFSLNAGLVYHDPLANRQDDTLAVGLGYGHVSPSVQALERTQAQLQPGVFTPIESSETFLEATYQYQVKPWWQIQPDVQYIFNPGAGAADPLNPAQRIKNALVLGARTNVLF